MHAATSVTSDSQQLIQLPESRSLLGFADIRESVPGSGRRLAVIPRFECSFSEFVRRTPPRSVALDGFVEDPSAIDLGSLHFNFNHHRGVSRMDTFCTSQQVEARKDEGLMDLLVESDTPSYWVWVNDPDPDSAFASYALLHPERTKSPIAHRLLSVVSELDISAGARGPAISSDIMRQAAWVFEPYFNALPRIYDLTAREIGNILDDQYQRISQHLMGQGHFIAIDARINVLAQGDSFLLIEEKGPYSRLKAFQQHKVDGLFVFKGESDAGYRYSAVRRNSLSYFPITLLSTALNRTESFVKQHGIGALGEILCAPRNSTMSQLWYELSSIPDPITKPWGGGDAVIGCLREKGSALTPALMASFAEVFMRDLARKAYDTGCFTLSPALFSSE